MNGALRFCGVIASLFLVFLWGGEALANGYLEIGTEEVKALMEKEKNVLLVFPLSKIEYDDLHISGAVNIPLTELETRLPADHTAPVIFYCIGEKSTASLRAASTAAKLGYRRVYAYLEGLPAWVAAGYPTTSLERLPNGWVPKITTEELSARLAKNGNLVVLDCGLEADTQRLRIDTPKRIYIPLEALHTRYKELPKNKEIAVICLTGTRSMAAARFLAAKGFATQSVDGGVQKWAVEKRPIVRNLGG